MCSKLINYVKIQVLRHFFVFFKIQVLGHFFIAFTPWFPQICTNDHETLPAIKPCKLRNAYVYQSIYTKSVALARCLILLLLSNFWKKLNVNKGNFGPFRWRHRQNMLTYFSEVVDSRLKIMDVRLVFENSSAKVTISGIFDLLLKFVTLSNSHFSDLQKTRVHNKGINILRFFKRPQSSYLHECMNV